MNDEMKDVWKDELGSSEPWDALAIESPPPLTARFRRPNWWPAVAVAASLLLVVSMAFNILLSQRLSDAKTDTLIALLQQDSPLVTLASIEDLRTRQLSERALDAIRDVVRYSEDPNSQLSALDALYELGQLDRNDAVEQLLAETRSNTEFMRTAIRAMTEEST